MNYWLVKSEPSKYSWDQLGKEKKTAGEGGRNYAARNNLRAMKKGDQALYYHSNEGKEIVGIAEIVKEAYQDPTTEDTNWVVVELKPLKAFATPVTLATIKADAALSKLELVRLSRLSVSAVTGDEFKQILAMGGLKA